MPAGEVLRVRDDAGSPVTSHGVASDPLADPFRPVEVDSALSPYDIARIERVVEYAQRSSGFVFSVFVGPSGEESRASATRLHAALDDADRAVLIAVDPAAHTLEIVTGSVIARVLGDAECRLAAATMQSSFALHDLAGGLTAGIQQLATAAYEAPMMHAGERY